MSYIGRDIRTGAFRQLDDISSGFDGSDTTHTMQVNSTNVSVGDVNQILLSLGGVIQKPGTDFTVSGSTLTFTTAPAANTNFFAILLGSDNGGTVTPTDGSVTGDKLASNIAITTSGDISFDGGSFVFNESSADKDFRMEGNGDANAFFLDGEVDRIYLGNNTNTSLNNCDSRLQIVGTDFDKSSISMTRYSNDANGATLVFGKSRNASIDGNTVVNSNDELGKIRFCGADGTDFGNTAVEISAFCNATPGSNDMPGGLKFSTAADGGTGASERMRIDRNGKVLIGSTADATSSNIQVITSDNNARVGFFQSTHSSNPFGILIDFDQAAPNNAVQSFLDGIDSSASRFSITSNGAFYGNGTYGTLSDERIKKDIVDANSQWDDIKAIKVRNFKKKVDGDSAIVEIGVVAQELEAVSPKLISELQPSKGEIRVNSEFGTLWTTDDAETKDGVDAVLYTAEDADVINGKNVEGGIKIPATHSKKVGDVKEVKQKVKGVKYSVLQIKALKALQEAMARIETLEADVKTLKGE
jgi:hypothetical protein